jgi:DNA helicase-2/ATP-dependent DNA helicase PcrA
VQERPIAATENIEDRWWADRRENLRAGLGFVAYRASDPPFTGRVPDFTTVAIGDELPESSDGATALVLPHLTPERLTDRVFVHQAGSLAAEATRRCIPVIAATSVSERELAAMPLTSDAEPWELDIDSLVGGTDLVFVLESSCVARFRDSDDAAYLTPIEARLARGLDERGISYVRQHFIGYHCVDFLVDGSLVVECDGAGYHDPDWDANRDEFLRARGYRVLRLSGRLIHHDTATAVDRIVGSLNGHGRRSYQPDEELSPPQMDAVMHGSGAARVSAPAGSGKTRVIAERVKRLISDGVDPSRICAISFTNKAVDEMNDRLARVAPDTRFTTIHSLAKEISERGPTGRRRLLIQGARSSRTPTRWAVLRPLLEETETFWRARDIWLDAITAYRQSFVVPDLSDFPEEQRPLPERLIELHYAYDRELESRGLTDFEGYILNALRGLARSAEYRQVWSSRYDYWIVDEYQDLPAAKLGLLRLLTSPADNVFIVGDDDQIIYGFAGADPGSFARFPLMYPKAADFRLGDNYRCDHEIVVRSSWLISRNTMRVDKPIRPVKSLGRPSVVVEDPSRYDEATLRFVKRELRRGVAPHDVALLFRLKDFAVPVEAKLAKAGIPYVPCSYVSFFDKSVVARTRSWLRLAANQASLADLRETLKWPKRYLKGEHLDRVAVEAGSEPVSRLGAVDAALRAAEGISEGQKRDALERWGAFVHRLGAVASPSQIIDDLNLRSVVDELDTEPGDVPAAVSFDVFRRFASEFDTVDELEDWIRRHGDDRDYAFDNTSPQSAGAQTGRVLLASIHQAKGQEYRSVAVLGPPDGMPDQRAVTLAALEEERRIAYVAVTRAEESLLFAASTQYQAELTCSPTGETWDDYVARTQSRF